ncbi:COG4 transport protein-domain-containing protein [Immersiella caudata]|uniref:Conserved oligomeric Golgi complex subunit 4 n=1 Tax=Immersiella caudata TaxID=314043 RepID=A0AA40CC62_9PEZI|nr:COG4 transport protein-domain-containing protein [Immersiella caudata]
MTLPTPRSHKPPPSSSDPSSALLEVTSATEVRAALAALHTQETTLSSHLSALLSAQQDISRSLARLDNLRAGLGAQVIAARGISNAMLSSAASTASHLSGHVRALDLEKRRVEDTLRVVEQVAELKACVAGVVGSMGAPQDWEAAAGYIARAAKVPDEIVRGGFAAAVVPTVEVPDAPWVTLESARESLCKLFLREFEKAATEGDGAKVTRFFKLFPLIGRSDAGLDVYGRYVCQGVASRARAMLKEGQAQAQGRRDGIFYAGALTKLFEHIAEIVDGHGSVVERHYGAGKMVKVIEKLQMEADVQGGIILDSWSDERAVDRRLTDVKSYPFSFLVQSFLGQQRGFGGTPRMNSPALGGGTNEARSSEDEGVDMKEVDALLREIAAMLEKWSVYARFLARKCKEPDAPEDAPFTVPDVLVKSNLSRKVYAKLMAPYKELSTFFFRRSVEKAFQMDEFPSGLTLNMSKTIESNSPYIISAVDVVMYIVNAVILRSLSTAQRGLIDEVLPVISTLLGTDFVGMIQRKMGDELNPNKPYGSDRLPPESKIVAFIVLINSLDISNEYLSRIVSGVLGSSHQGGVTQIPNDASSIPDSSPLKEAFPFKNDLRAIATRLSGLNASFTTKTTELLNLQIQELFKQVFKPRLRSVHTDPFRDANYGLTEEELAEWAAENDETEEDVVDKVVRIFESRWEALIKPIGRLMTPRTFTTVHDLTARYLARVLEKRVWGYAGGKCSPYGAIRMERDFGAIVGVVSRGNYAVREVFGKTTQILMVANMDDEEWDEMVAGVDEDGGMLWVLSEDERKRARTIVKT